MRIGNEYIEAYLEGKVLDPEYYGEPPDPKDIVRQLMQENDAMVRSHDRTIKAVMRHYTGLSDDQPATHRFPYPTSCRGDCNGNSFVEIKKGLIERLRVFVRLAKPRGDVWGCTTCKRRWVAVTLQSGQVHKAEDGEFILCHDESLIHVERQSEHAPPLLSTADHGVVHLSTAQVYENTIMGNGTLKVIGNCKGVRKL